MSNSPEIRYCRQCEKQLYGRADQVYCNDTCRNTFNKQKEKLAKTPPHPKEKEIFAIIRRNYDILKRLCPQTISSNNAHSYKSATLHTDFNRNFFTGITKTERGIWHLCFDRGWLEEGDSIVVKDFFATFSLSYEL